jgi:hypothetical protein
LRAVRPLAPVGPATAQAAVAHVAVAAVIPLARLTLYGRVAQRLRHCAQRRHQGVERGRVEAAAVRHAQRGLRRGGEGGKEL